MSRLPLLLENGRHRAAYGCILTFENAQGETLVMHRTGAPQDVIRALCDDALTLDPSFRVVSYSTPQTIYSDWLGRMPSTPFGRANTTQNLPEPSAVKRAGRGDMLHPRLSGAARYGR